MIQFIVFAIVGMVETAPNVCKIEYMRYVDVESVTIPCNEIRSIKDKEDLLQLK